MQILLPLRMAHIVTETKLSHQYTIWLLIFTLSLFVSVSLSNPLIRKCLFSTENKINATLLASLYKFLKRTHEE